MVQRDCGAKIIQHMLDHILVCAPDFIWDQKAIPVMADHPIARANVECHFGHFQNIVGKRVRSAGLNGKVG